MRDQVFDLTKRTTTKLFDKGIGYFNKGKELFKKMGEQQDKIEQIQKTQPNKAEESKSLRWVVLYQNLYQLMEYMDLI